MLLLLMLTTDLMFCETIFMSDVLATNLTLPELLLLFPHFFPF